MLNLVRGARYELELTYRYPSQKQSHVSTGTIEAEMGENLRCLGRNALDVDSYGNTILLPFAAKRYPEENEDGVSLKFSSRTADCELIGPSSRLLFKIRESMNFWIQIATSLFLFSLLSVLIGSDFSKLPSPLAFMTILRAFRLKILAGFFQAGILFWLFRLVGKKFM